MGMDINVHDQWAVESPGRIHDRTKEHLGKGDIGVIKYRKLLLAAIQAVKNGSPAPFALDADAASEVRGPIAVDAVELANGHSECWVQLDVERRRQCAWAEVNERSRAAR
jgi:hypothetical protein